MASVEDIMDYLGNAVDSVIVQMVTFETLDVCVTEKKLRDGQ